MTKEEIKRTEELYDRCELTRDFSCDKCKKTIKQDNCKGCPIYVTHFDNDLKKKTMAIKDKVQPLWNEVKESLDLKGKFIRFNESDDQKADDYMFVEDCKVDFKDFEEISYELKGTMLNSNGGLTPHFAVINTKRTYFFSFKSLLEDDTEITDIEVVSKDEFDKVFDEKVRYWKEFFKQK